MLHQALWGGLLGGPWPATGRTGVGLAGQSSPLAPEGFQALLLGSPSRPEEAPLSAAGAPWLLLENLPLGLIVRSWRTLVSPALHTYESQHALDFFEGAQAPQESHEHGEDANPRENVRPDLQRKN